MEMVLDPWILPWAFGKRFQRSSSNDFGWEGVACVDLEQLRPRCMHPMYPHKQFPATKEPQQALAGHCTDTQEKAPLVQSPGSPALGTRGLSRVRPGSKVSTHTPRVRHPDLEWTLGL